MILALALLFAAGPARLLPGATGKLCLDCHSDFPKKAFVHTPVKSQECTGCHNPHASQHGKLLSAEPSQVCASCHAGKTSHTPAAKCTSCHDPHSSNEKFELKAKGPQLCASCHQAVVDQALAAKVPHAPIAQGCTSCHDPHGGAPKTCAACHKTSEKQHLGFTVSPASCTGCHDPHGSDQKGMLFNNVHKPVANRQCNECHQSKAKGAELCKQCHSGQVAQMLAKSKVHQAVIDPQACLNCHSPHAARERGLLKGKLTQVCGACHADTIARQQKSPTQHPPVRDGSCATCHDPHSSDSALLLKKADCGACHDYQKHQTHPIGPKIKDPRNRNLTLDCLSCHRAHGTDYKHMIPYPTPTEMCVKCHERFRR